MEAKPREGTSTWRVVKINGGRRQELDDEIASEYPLTVRLDGEEFATFVCTPADLEEMVVGFLASEGVILVPDDMTGLSIDVERGMADVELKRRHTAGAEFYGKRFIGSCCGKGRQFYLLNDARTAKTSTTQLRVTAERCMKLMAELQSASAVYRHTGGVHNAALCRAEDDDTGKVANMSQAARGGGPDMCVRLAGGGGCSGSDLDMDQAGKGGGGSDMSVGQAAEGGAGANSDTGVSGDRADGTSMHSGLQEADGSGLIVVRSDIGRHNALDKVYGHCLLHRVPTRDAIVAFSGRLSSEVVLKTAKIGAGVLLSNAAPTDLALELAQELGITAAGFIRGTQMNVYTHPERIV